MQATTQLTKDQTEAWEFILDKLDLTMARQSGLPDIDHIGSEVALMGYAGTGKTFLVRELVQDLAQAGWKVACTAPTNKAVQVFGQGLTSTRGITLSTTHKFLGLKMKIDQRTGEEMYVRDEYSPIPDAEVLIVDEASMVGQQLLKLVREHKPAWTRVLWVGDPAQLPPVKENHSPAFHCEDRFLLQEVIRFGNAIGDYATKVRERIEQDIYTLPYPRENHDGQEGLFLRHYEAWVLSMLDDFKSEAFKKDSNFVRALAWRNEKVNRGNRVVHRAIYGPTAPPFMVGQTLIAGEPICLPDQTWNILMATSDECVIQEVHHEPFDGYDAWTLVVKDSNGSRFEFRVLDQPERVRFEKYLEELKEEIKQIKGNDYVAKQDRKDAWKAFFAKKATFADLGPCYWSTVHKAQGSTFKRAYVDMGDIGDNPNARERCRMLYTAFTRASNQLVLLM